MKKIIVLLLIFPFIARAEIGLGHKLSGRIVLQVEMHGEAWYISPDDNKRYFLGRPDDAFELLHRKGMGITNSDMSKIPIGITGKGSDSDNDGLYDELEIAIGTDFKNKDSDDDGYDDKTEIENNYNPLDIGPLNYNDDFIKNNLGRIFLAVENKGQAWYLNPIDKKRYFLNRPIDAFEIMRKFGLGITNSNLQTIQEEKLITNVSIDSDAALAMNTPACQNCNTGKTYAQVVSGAASAIRSGDKEKAVLYFTPEMKKAVEYTLNFLDSAGKLTLGNILSGSTVKNANDNEVIYSNEIYYSMGGYKVPVEFVLQKQENGEWLLSNL